MATVRKRKWTHNGVEREAWVVSYTDQGGKRRQATFNKKKEADAYRIKTEDEIVKRIHVAPSQTETLRDAINAWIEDRERRWRRGEVSGLTLYGNRSKIRFLPDSLMQMKLIDITGMKVEEWATDALKTYSKSTVVNFVSIINLSLGFAVRRRKIAINPLVHDKVRISLGKRKRVTIPSREQIGQIIQSLGPDGDSSYLKGPRGNSLQMRALIVALGIFQGLRRGEIAGLQWGDVDFQNNTLRVVHSYSRVDKLKSPKTAAGKRSVPLARPTRAMLQHVWSTIGEPSEGFVLTGRRGLPVDPNKLTSFHWPEIMKRANLVDEGGKPLFSMHAMRHAYVSLLVAAGMSPLLVSKQVGHSKTSVTLDVYSHLFNEDDTGAASIEIISNSFDDTTRPAIASLVDATRARHIPLTH